MEEKVLKGIIHVQSETIVKQTHKINLLEEKFTDLRKKYLRLKYDSENQFNHQMEMVY